VADGSFAAKSLPYQDLRYMATSAHGDGIYLLDAYPQVIFKTTQKYNPQTDVWTSVKRIPTYRAVATLEQAAVAVTVGSGIYVLGGGAPPSDVRQRLEVYSPLSDSWTTKTAIPFGSGAAGAGGGSCGSTVVFGGGYPNKNTFALYNTATDLWAAGKRPAALRCARPVGMRSTALRGVRCHAACLQAPTCLLVSCTSRAHPKGTIFTSLAARIPAKRASPPSNRCIYTTVTQGRGRQVMARASLGLDVGTARRLGCMPAPAVQV
jgi:hypothetical protein